MVPDLDRIRMLWTCSARRSAAYPAIHLTGTNGKTSTARMVDALLQGFGLRPGRYTSPHLDSVTERITVDGAAADRRALRRGVRRARAVRRARRRAHRRTA